MFEICIPFVKCIPSQALFAQLLLGLINGSFYAVLSLGLAVIFGLLDIVNFAHGALYMLGALGASLCGMVARYGTTNPALADRADREQERDDPRDGPGDERQPRPAEAVTEQRNDGHHGDPG